MIELIVRDLRFALRMLRKTPGFTATAILTLALGVGVNTAIFSVVNALLIRPLPYPDADRLVTARFSTRTARGVFTRNAVVDGATFLNIRDHATTIDVAARGSGGWGGGVNLVAANQAANVVQSRVSAGYFGVLGVRPAIGREFTSDEDRAGGPPAAILSYGLWSRMFDRDPDIVGSSIMLRGQAYTVVGVLPQAVTGSGADVWTPLRPSTTGEGSGTNYSLIARLRPAVEGLQASAEVNQIVGSLMASRPRPEGISVTAELIPLQTADTAGIRDALLMLWGAVGLVLLIACVNVAGLLLARTGMRDREIATRIALGSGRGAVIRQLLVENVVLGLLGGGAGVALGWLVLEALKALSADVFSFASPIVLDRTVLAVTVVIALGTSVVFGLVPALHASRVEVQAGLAETGTRSVAGGSTGWPRRILVVGEVAMGVVLLVGAGLLVRTFVGLKNLDPGFDPANVLTTTVSLQDARYEDSAKVARLFEDSLLRVRQAPGVTSAAVALGLPYTRLLNLGFRPLDGDAERDKGLIANVSYVTPGYFDTLRVKLQQGRDFSDLDQATSIPVAIVNEEFMRRYYRHRDAVGRHISVVSRDESRQIIGVVANVRATASGFQDYNDPLVTPPIIYLPATQLSAGFLKLVHTWFSPSWVVRASITPESVAPAVRQAIGSVDPLLPIARLETMSGVQAAALAMQRFMMALVVGLGALALVLAAVGIQGLIASSVSERKRELGIRLALGATGGRVMRTVVAPGIALTAFGLALGGVAAFGVTRLMQAFIWGVRPTDPLTFCVVMLGLLAVALVASLVPALRVLRLDPALTLRAE